VEERAEPTKVTFRYDAMAPDEGARRVRGNGVTAAMKYAKACAAECGYSIIPGSSIVAVLAEAHDDGQRIWDITLEVE
jgi:hypothetical protein